MQVQIRENVYVTVSFYRRKMMFLGEDFRVSDIGILLPVTHCTLEVMTHFPERANPDNGDVYPETYHETFARGASLLSPTDKYDSVKGKKIALHRAMDECGLSQDERTKIWDAVRESNYGTAKQKRQKEERLPLKQV